jgi:Integrase core domain
MDEDAVARGDAAGQVGRVGKGEPGLAVIERAVHQFADEAAVQDDLSRDREKCLVAFSQVCAVGCAAGMDDCIVAPEGQRRRQGRLAGPVASFQHDDLVGGELCCQVTMHGRASRAAVNPAMLEKRAVTAYWIIRLRQFGSRPSATVCQVPACAASTGRPAAAQAPVIRAAPGGVSGPCVSTTANPAEVAAAQAAGARIVRSAVQAPRMNSIMERWIGSCRRELLDRTLVWNQRHLMTVLREYEDFYNIHRPHRTLNQAAPLRPLPDGVTELSQFRVRRHPQSPSAVVPRIPGPYSAKV